MREKIQLSPSFKKKAKNTKKIILDFAPKRDKKKAPPCFFEKKITKKKTPAFFEKFFLTPRGTSLVNTIARTILMRFLRFRVFSIFHFKKFSF